jgi:hypothetical protein
VLVSHSIDPGSIPGKDKASISGKSIQKCLISVKTVKRMKGILKREYQEGIRIGK